MPAPSPIARKPENPWLNLVCNVVLPTVVLMRLSGWNLTAAVLVACAFPIGYGVYDWVVRREINFLSILGLVAVGLKGVFTLAGKDPMWIACSESALPLLFGGAILWTSRWEVPLVQRFLLSPQMFDLDRVRRLLALRGNGERLRPLMVQSSVAYAGTMLLSAVLNFVLARAILRADPGTPEFGEQLGKLNGLQYPVIALPLTALTLLIFVWLMRRLGELTGSPVQELMAAHHQPAAEGSGDGA